MNTVSIAHKGRNKVNPAVIARSLATISEAETPTRQLKGSCQDCRLSDLCLSRELNMQGMNALNQIVSFRQPLRKKQHLYRQGDKFGSIYFVRSGYLKSCVTNKEGDELAVSFIFPGEVVGLDGLHGKEHTSSVSALGDTFLCEIPFHALEKLFVTQPLVQKRFIELQSRQIVQEQEMTMLRGEKTAADQLVAFLANLSARYARIRLSPTSFRLPMTRKDIAACLGLTIETVSRLFTQFHEDDLLSVDGREVTLTQLAA